MRGILALYKYILANLSKGTSESLSEDDPLLKKAATSTINVVKEIIKRWVKEIFLDIPPHIANLLTGDQLDAEAEEFADMMVGLTINLREWYNLDEIEFEEDYDEDDDI